MKVYTYIYIALLALVSVFTISYPVQAFNSLSECLIVNDIGKFKYKENRSNMGNGSGVVGASEHFNDHIDKICSGSYSNIYELRGLPREEIYEKVISIDVQVTQHAGADSDQWLLHELDLGHRTYYGLPGQSLTVQTIDGNNILVTISGGGDYRWISGNKVIDIRYTDLQLEKPEPLEIVTTYLAKFPSTMPAQTSEGMREGASLKKWIKDEMERRLWLCGKWYMQVQLEKATQDGIARDVHKHLETFVNYREKYFGIDGKADREALSSYVYTRNHTALKAKYEDLKQWWADNKDKDITLP